MVCGNGCPVTWRGSTIWKGAKFGSTDGCTGTSTCGTPAVPESEESFAAAAENEDGKARCLEDAVFSGFASENKNHKILHIFL